MNDYDSSEQNVHSSNFKPNDQTHFENRDRLLSPNHEKPNPLDLDLMSDLQHIINRQTSPLKSATQLIENDSWASLDRARGNTLQSEEETINDLILLNNGDMRNQSKLHESNVDCVIFDPLLQPALNADESESRDMLRKNLPSGLPRPPSKSSIQHIARNHNIQQQSIDQLQHQPLARTFETNSKSDIDFSFGTNPFVNSTEIGDAKIKEEHEALHRVVNRNSDANKCNGAVKTRHLYSKSSENLLQEYGLDFSKLSIARNGKTEQNDASTYHISQQQPDLLHPQNNSSTIRGKNMDIFADLDPLGKKNTDKFKPVPPPRPSQPPPLRPTDTNIRKNAVNNLVDLAEFDINACDPFKNQSLNTISQPVLTESTETFPSPPPPIVPPRTRRSSQNTVKSTQPKWTTFE